MYILFLFLYYCSINFYFLLHRRGGDWIYFPKIILRDAPKLWPDCVAPRLVPACRPIIASLARNCWSENSRRFSSDGLGPKNGPRHSGWRYVCEINYLARLEKCFQQSFFEVLTALPTAKIVCVTNAMFFMSHKSVVWKRSTSGTPYLMQAFWNL